MRNVARWKAMKAAMRNQNGDLVVLLTRDDGTEAAMDFDANKITGRDVAAILEACGCSVEVKGFTPDEAQAIVVKAWPPETTITDMEEIETYVNGPDDPEAYFAKFVDEGEVVADFEGFLAGYERG